MRVYVFQSPEQLEDFAARWRQFEVSAAAEFFQTWAWVGSILNCLRGTLAVKGVLVEARAQPVLMCLFYADAEEREWSALEPGTSETFALCSEYNLPLLAAGLTEDESRAFVLAMVGAFPPSAVLRFGAVPTAWGELLRACGTRVEVWRSRIAPVLDFGKGQANPPSARGETARRLRLSVRLYSPVAVEHASSAADRTAMLAELIELHGRYWRSRGKLGVFHEQSMRGFHTHLVSRDEADKSIALFRVRAGLQTIAILYGFRHRNRFYAYQSGFHYDHDNRKRPGLLAHTLFASYLAEVGAASYNLLAGDFRYKRSLTNSHEQLDWLRVHCDSAFAHAIQGGES